jgi:hypothetical protein
MTVAIDHLFEHSFTVRRRVVEDDGVGGQDVDWVDVGTVRGRASVPQSGSASEVASGFARGERLPYYVYLPFGSDVRRGDVLIGADLELWVEGTALPSKRIYLRADCRQYQADSGKALAP